MKKHISRGTAAALCILTAVCTFNVTLLALRNGFNQLLPSYTSQQHIYGTLGEIKQTVDKYYVGTYNEEDALNMAATGFMVGVGDQWSSYLTKEQFEAYKLDFAGQLVGIGVSVGYDEENEVIRVTDVYDGSPAENAGIAIGDFIVEADGVSVKEDGYSAVVDAVRGEEGTFVEVTIQKTLTSQPKTLTIQRAKVDKVVVRGSMVTDETGYIRISDFDGGADTQFEQAVNYLIDSGAKNLIFDVRFNPGGSVVVVSNMLDMLLPEGDIITLKPKEGEGTTYTSDANELEMPMAVLVNSQSISAAEFFAAALQEYNKAVIVGDKTLGKGYSQRQYVLSDGSALILSDQEYFTPKGKNLAGTGIVPDIEVSLSEEAYAGFALLDHEDDAQLQEAIAALEK